MMSFVAKHRRMILLIIVILSSVLLSASIYIIDGFIFTPTSHKNVERLYATTSKKLTDDYSVCFAITDRDPVYGDYIRVCVSGPASDHIWNEQRQNSKLLVDGVSVPYTTFKKSILGKTYHIFLVNCLNDFQTVSFSIDDTTVCFADGSIKRVDE